MNSRRRFLGNTRPPKPSPKREPLDVEKMVYRAGFFRAKTKSIMGACRMIVEKFGGEVPKTMDELLELPGIGRKSANVILGAAYGIASGIVVDTHMIRLANRFHLSRGDDPVKIEQDLCRIVPRKDWIYFSQSMVLHGRYICLAKGPRCWECHLIKICPYPDKILEPKKRPGNGAAKDDYGKPDYRTGCWALTGCLSRRSRTSRTGCRMPVKVGVSLTV